MLRKRTRSVQKDQNQMGHQQQQIFDSGSESSINSDGGNKNPKSNSFYTIIPGLLVGLSPKGLALTDCDSVRSPTSPLDFRLFSGLGNPFRSSSTSTPTNSSSLEIIGQQRSWVGLGGGVNSGSKLGLISIIDSLDDNHENNHVMKFSGKVPLRSPSEGTKNILFGPKLRVVKNHPQNETSSSPKSLPKNYVVFPHSSKPKSPLQKGSSDVLFEIADTSSESLYNDSFGKIRSCSLDSCRTISNLSGLRVKNNNNNPNSSSIGFTLEDFDNINKSSPNSNSNQVSSFSDSQGKGFIGSLSATEIELSEDYTCVISHGSNPKTTHIFGDCILETHSNDLSNNLGKSWESKEVNTNITNPEASVQKNNPFDDFLSFCYSCNKKLEDGKDIYIYRGEKAFCSLNCRSLEILIDEELEKSSDKDEDNNDEQDDCKDLFFETGQIA